jgi:uncharacterized protein (TIGR03437 family)
MNSSLACVVGLACCSLLADTPTVYVGDRYEHRIAAVATDAAGNTYVTGSRVFRTPPPRSSDLPGEQAEVFVAKLDSTNERLWIRYFSGKGTDRGTAVAADGDGNVYVAGSTTSPNFPLQNPLQSDPASAFVLKMAPDGSRLVWSTYYGTAGTHVSSVAIAPDGTLVLGGYVITSAFRNTQALVAKIDVTASKVLWDQRFGGTQLACTGGSSCFLSPRNNSGRIALDSSGNIYAAGNTNTLDFPTTPGAFLERGYGPFIRKFTPSGTLVWSTYLTDNRVGMGYPVSPADTLTALAVGQDGSVYFAGGGSPKWPTTPGAYRTAWEGAEWPPFGPPGVPNSYVARLNPTGSALVYSTFIGHNNAVPTSVAVDSNGSAWVSGFGDYITAVNPTGTSLAFDNTWARGSRGTQIVVDGNARIHAAGEAGVVTIVDRTPPPSGLSGVANAAGTQVAGRIVPGELISIYGWNLGNYVLVDELQAPVLYASPNQVNAIVPFAIGGRERVALTVRRDGVETARAVLAVARSQPEIFKLPEGQMAAALNEDGTVNSATNPARAGSLVSVWGTGAPGWPRETRDGSLNPSEPLLHLSLSAVAGFQEYTPTTYTGAAPGTVAGMFQINLRLPATIYPPELGTVEIYVVSPDNEISQPASVYVRQ